MAYVGLPFQHDIFVSYSHGSDADGQPMLKDWSVAFVRALEDELRSDRDYRNALSLFIDSHDRPGQRLDRMLPLTEQLESQVGAAALLLVLMSPDYQASRWCADERQWWWQRQQTLGLTAAGRVAMVKTWPLSQPWADGRWPHELSDRANEPLLGFPFHSGEGRGARPLGWTQWNSGFGPEVREAVLGLANDIYRKLEDIRADADRLRVAQANAQRLASSTGQTLYLHGRRDQLSEWEHAVAALQEGGFVVMPSEPDPVERDSVRRQDARERRVELLADCDALVLVGSSDGLAIDQDLVVVGKQDRQSARARSNRQLPCALLDTAGMPVASEVRRRNARILQTDWLDATQDAVVPVVQRWLCAAAARP